MADQSDKREESAEALARQLPEQIARVRSQVAAAKARLRRPIKDDEPEKNG